MISAEQAVEYFWGAKLASIRVLSGKTIVIEAHRDGQRLQITANVGEILSPEALPSSVKPATGFKVSRTNQTRGGQSVFQQRSHWPLEVLRREGLPLYWNQEWIQQQIERHGTIEKAAEANGYNPQTVNKFANLFGLSFRPRVQPDLKKQALALRAEGLSLAEISKRLGISKATVHRALGRSNPERP